MQYDRRIVLGGLAVSISTLPALAAKLPPTLAEDGREIAPVAPDTMPAHEVASVSPDGFILLEAKAGKLRLKGDPAHETPVWGYNGQVPGPILRVKKGAELKVRLSNALEQPITMSVQGLRGPNAMDGVGGLTQTPIKPGEHFDYRFTPPDSGLFWYHSHVFPHTAEQTGRGLYGLLIVDETAPPPVDEELAVTIADWSLGDDGQIHDDFHDLDKARQAGRNGVTLSANGEAAPAKITMRPGSRLRLRLVNAATAQIMILSFEGLHPQVVGIDGQPCEMFEPVRQSVPAGPGARFDVILDLPAEAGKETRLIARADGVSDRVVIAFKTEGEPRKQAGPPTSLHENPALPEAIALERAFKMDVVVDGGDKPKVQPPKPEPSKPDPSKARAAKPDPKTAGDKTPVKAASEPATDAAHLWTINGASSDGLSGKPLFKVKRGTPVSLSIINKSAFPQQISVRGHVFRLLHDLDDGWEPYWRDTVLITPGHTKHIAFLADNPGKWALESSILDRQVTGLATWFEVG